MLNLNSPLYLASNSPRRKKMLHSLGIDFHHITIDHEEIINANHSPLKNVKRLADEKCRKAASKISDGIVISADTIVVLDNKGLKLGTHPGFSDAENMNKLLQFYSTDIHTKKTWNDFINGL